MIIPQGINKVLNWEMRLVRLAYQPPASSTFLSEQISHQPSATSQTNRLMEHTFVAKGFGLLQGIILNKSTQMEAYTYKRR
jgi:hypothetical protein